jgi:hypothetical protein
MDSVFPAQKSGLYPLTTPILPDFEWVNQGTSTAVETSSGISFDFTYAADRLVQGLVNTAAVEAGDRYYEICLLPPMFDIANAVDDIVGLIIQGEDGADTGYHLFGVGWKIVTSIPQLWLRLYSITDPASGSGVATLLDEYFIPHAGPIWLRCEVDVSDTVGNFSYSFDGQEFMATTIGSITDTFSFDAGGVGAYTENNLKVTMASFKSGAL